MRTHRGGGSQEGYARAHPDAQHLFDALDLDGLVDVHNLVHGHLQPWYVTDTVCNRGDVVYAFVVCALCYCMRC